ncbi:triose-phosphate isomerase [Halopenitus persicus]|uniref:Triosephosphate isomerase n=1 Tax=Halopenitus persicus TaxID=1048396 RepID=A0A1H3DX56_9EURY|nr:triose-phosphate isomerase [Halopenitus persicus]SDX70179.1 triosephosphate isomerase [Halopenitus persicus]
MALPTPAFLCSFKTYPGTAGRDGLELARSLSRAATDAAERTESERSSPIRLAVAPQTPDVRLLSRETDLTVIAQAADAADPGEGTGDVLVETLADAGADAVFVNHPEREQSLPATRTLIERCADSGMDAIVCVRGVEEGIAAVELGADWLLLEKPTDVASGDPLVRRHPDRVRTFVERVRSAAAAHGRDVAIAVGGGISRPADVAAAFELGVDAVGAASSVVTAADPAARLETLLSEDPS